MVLATDGSQKSYAFYLYDSINWITADTSNFPANEVLPQVRT